MDLQAKYNGILAREGHSVRPPNKKRPHGKSNSKLYREYMEHPTAQYVMRFTEWKRQGARAGKSKTFDA
jgi:hypothetical protein